MNKRAGASAGRPADPGPGPGGLYDVARLSARLGISPTSLRGLRLRRVDWLPTPAGFLNQGPVWHAADLEGIEARRRRPGRPAGQPKE